MHNGVVLEELAPLGGRAFEQFTGGVRFIGFGTCLESGGHRDLFGLGFGRQQSDSTAMHQSEDRFGPRILVTLAEDRLVSLNLLHKLSEPSGGDEHSPTSVIFVLLVENGGGQHDFRLQASPEST